MTSIATGCATSEGPPESDPAPGTTESDKGVVYCCDGLSEGQRTPSGDPYVGTSVDKARRAKTATDGRERQNPTNIGEYDKGEGKGRKEAERKGMNDRRGKEKLDNKRDEIRRDNWPERGIEPPR